MSLLPILSLIVKQSFFLELEGVPRRTAVQAMCGERQGASMQPLAHRRHCTNVESSGMWAWRAGAGWPGTDKSALSDPSAPVKWDESGSEKVHGRGGRQPLAPPDYLTDCSLPRD